MDEYEDLDAYNGNVEHAMRVDDGYHQHTEELPEWFDEDETNEHEYARD